MNTENEVFSLLSQDPGTGVAVLDRDGVLQYINEISLRIFFADPVKASDVIGKNLIEMGFPKEWADERVRLIREIEKTGREMILRTIWQGKQQFSWMRSLDGEDGETFRVLVVTRRVGTGEEAGMLLESEMGVVHSGVAGLGELATLTKRELEVLTLIGQGLTAKEIANLIHRSVKTVDNHRIALGQKLQKTNRVELAMIAREAGLVLDDSERTRV